MIREEKIRLAARVAHSVNRAYCSAIGDSVPKVWRELTSGEQECILAGVRDAVAYPDATPEDSHKRWMKFKLEVGWKYGPVKDVGAKVHPCLVPYAELPKEQQVKDFLFLAVVRGVFGG